MIHCINDDENGLSFDEFYAFMVNNQNEFITPLEKQVANLSKYINKLYTIGTIAYQKNIRDGHTMGVVIGYTDNTPDNISYVTQVVVRAEDRGKGLVQKLFSEYEMVCKNKGLKEIWLTTEINNYPAKRAYEKYGFITSGMNGKGLIIFRKKVS